MTATLEQERATIDEDLLAFDVPNKRPRMSGRRLFALVVIAGVMTAFGAQAGYFSARLFDNVWQARTEIEYRGNSWTETEDVAIKSRSLTDPIAAVYDIDIKTFEEDLKAGLVPGTQILRIEYFDTDAAMAQAIVSDLAEAYIADASERPPEASREVLEEQLAELEGELEDAQAQLSREAAEPGVPLTPGQQDLQAAIATYRARIGVIELRLLDDELELQTVEARGLPRYVTRPFVFEEPFFPRPMRLGLLGAALGFFLGLTPFVWNLYRPEIR